MTCRKKKAVRSKIFGKIKIFEDFNVFSCLECIECVMKNKVIRRKKF